ncbi:aldehyde dehydrogenase family protein [Parasphingorhabdus cellanae]|uniref:Aldehyde dehydrogenase family protein n=1 Tax=Parasphingorhabdus cellanae TaxID=2806553 RepID=A0ABX7T2R1_9SPHN|nr:aldehyde dehydrogenase family protein [Parasphingorhabdus cellanae]QTD55831.1 aldehyde dehydrogenase family protein [Parasphingorhabdus cellanae]
MQPNVKLYIDGKPAAARGMFEVVNPATAEPFAQCPSADLQMLDTAVAAARKAFPAWAAKDIEDRATLVEQIGDALEARKEEFTKLLSSEQGKPVHSGAVGEIMGALAWLRATAKLRPAVDVIKDDDVSYVEVRRKPLGVVASITPWNHPVMIAIWHVIPALIAGNTVVIKPSSMTPLTTLLLAELANEILPAGVVNSVAGEGGLGQAISSHPGIDKIVFTGSTPTGRHIMESAAANLKRLTLELGGNDAAIVLADADVDAIAPKIFAKTFGNSGQTCAALKRLYVHDSIHDALADRLAQMAKDAKMGPGDNPESQYGPIQNKSQFDFVVELADDARSQGAQFLAGGKADDGAGYFYPLTVVTQVTDGMRLVDEEQFGPILPIIRYHDVEDVLARANDNPNGLGGSIWSSDIDTATALAARMETGTAWVNDHATISPDAPFGGAKQSGIGVEFGHYGLEEYMQLQTIRIAK